MTRVSQKGNHMKLGINSLFLLGFDFEEGLRLSHQLGAQAI